MTQALSRVSAVCLFSILTASLASAQSISRVSTDSVGGQATGGGSGVPGVDHQSSVNADGRFVAFMSFASNLVSSDINFTSDIFVKDRVSGAVTLVSVKTDGSHANGPSYTPVITPDARYVAFVSKAQLVADDTNPCAPDLTCADIYVHDRFTGITTRESVANDGSQANGASDQPQISADGRYVVFQSFATNLVAGDTNAAGDLFVRDRVNGTTTRISVATGGAQADGLSESPVITSDGNVIAFLSKATNLTTTPDTLFCDVNATIGPYSGPCSRLYVHTRSTGKTERVAITGPVSGSRIEVLKAAISANGRTIAVDLAGFVQAGEVQDSQAALLLLDRGTGKTTVIRNERARATITNLINSVSVNSNGRIVASCLRTSFDTVFTYVKLVVFDRVTGFTSMMPLVPQIPGVQPLTSNQALSNCDGATLNSDGTIVVFNSTETSLVAGDTNDAADVFAIDRDADHDGMTSDWEMTFGFDPANPADAAADPDSDGTTNAQEFQAGTQPLGGYKRYLAEGAQNAFFSTFIHLYNPNLVDTPVEVKYLGDSGTVTTETFTLGAQQGKTLTPHPPDASFSTVVTSDQVVAVERTMTWAGGGLGAGYGSGAETGIEHPNTTWYFAEGTTGGPFSLFYLLQNPTATDATATITYLLPAPQAPIVRSYPVKANSRVTIPVDDEPGLGATDISAKIQSDQPIFAERALYLSRPDQPFAGGTSGAGLPAPATKWFIAEGVTGGFWDLYFLIGNPSPSDANVTVTYLPADGGGPSFDQTCTVAAQSRLTIDVKRSDPRLANTAVSAIVNSTNAVPIVVERTLWWPSPDWYEGSLTAATTEAGPRWALAGGYIANTADTHTFLLVANPASTFAQVTFALTQQFLDDGSQAVCKPLTISIGEFSRYTLDVNQYCHTDRPSIVGGTITSDVRFGAHGPTVPADIVVERATYWSVGDKLWAAGASTLMTKLP